MTPYDAWKTTPPDDEHDPDGREVIIYVMREVELRVRVTVGDPVARIETLSLDGTEYDCTTRAPVALTGPETEEAYERGLEQMEDAEQERRDRAVDAYLDARKEASLDDR
jgi:hypothetical protein